MNKRELRKTITLFTLLAFLGSLLPCQCLAGIDPISTDKTTSTSHTSSHDCCDSDRSSDADNSTSSSEQDNCCCSGCKVYMGVSTSGISASFPLTTDHSKEGNLLSSRGLYDALYVLPNFLPRGSPHRRILILESSTTLASRLCRWLI